MREQTMYRVLFGIGQSVLPLDWTSGQAALGPQAQVAPPRGSGHPCGATLNTRHAGSSDSPWAGLKVCSLRSVSLLIEIEEEREV